MLEYRDHRRLVSLHFSSARIPFATLLDRGSELCRSSSSSHARTPAQRREQRRRADARFARRPCKMEELQHRGFAPSHALMRVMTDLIEPFPREHISERNVDQAVDAPFPQDVASARRRLTVLACCRGSGDPVSVTRRCLCSASSCDRLRGPSDRVCVTCRCLCSACSCDRIRGPTVRVGVTYRCFCSACSSDRLRGTSDRVCVIMCSAYPCDRLRGNSTCLHKTSESELSALRAEAEAEPLELATAYAELEAQSGGGAAACTDHEKAKGCAASGSGKENAKTKAQKR